MRKKSMKKKPVVKEVVPNASVETPPVPKTATETAEQKPIHDFVEVVKPSEPTVTGTYGFKEIARFVSADGREVRKLEAMEKHRDPYVLIKTSTRFFDEDGKIIACSEALATIQGTILSLTRGTW